MKKIIFIQLLIIASVQLNAQSKFKLGLNYYYGASTFYGSDKNGDHLHAATSLPVYSLKSSYGTGLKLQYSIREKLGITLAMAYQQKGAMFDKGMYGYTPRYRFNYLDIGLGLQYLTKPIIKNSSLYLNLSGNYGILINSQRVNNYESSNLMSDSQMSDLGTIINVGLNIPRVEKDAFQIGIVANIGIKNVFGGILEQNGQRGKNIFIGIQLGYLFSFTKANSSK